MTAVLMFEVAGNRVDGYLLRRYHGQGWKMAERIDCPLSATFQTIAGREYGSHFRDLSEVE